MAGEVQVTLRETAPIVVLDLRGPVTTFADDAIMGAYRDACERGARNILLNFTEVNYLNSAGIAIVIGVLTEARNSARRLLITGLTPHYQKIFEIMGLAQYVSIFETEDAARRSVVTENGDP